MNNNKHLSYKINVCKNIIPLKLNLEIYYQWVIVFMQPLQDLWWFTWSLVIYMIIGDLHDHWWFAWSLWFFWETLFLKKTLYEKLEIKNKDNNKLVIINNIMRVWLFFTYKDLLVRIIFTRSMFFCFTFTSWLQKSSSYGYCSWCTVNSKINGTPKGVYLPISKLHFNSAVVNVASKWASKHL